MSVVFELIHSFKKNHQRMASRCKRESCYSLKTRLWNKVIWHQLTQLVYSLYNFYDLLSTFEGGPGVQGPHHWLPRTPEHKKDVFKAAIWHSHLTTCPWPARSHPSGRPLSWFRRFWTDGPVIREQHHSNAMGLTGMQSSDCMLERYLRLDRYPQNIWQSQWRNAAKHPPNHAFESNTKPPGASQNRRLWHKERQYCVEATVIKRMCLSQSDSNHQNVTVHCAQCISTLVTSLKRIFRLLPGCNCTPTSTEPTPSAPSPSSKDVAMPKGWFPGTSSHSGWTKSGHGHLPQCSAPTFPPPFCTSHSEAVRVSRRHPNMWQRLILRLSVRSAKLHLRCPQNSVRCHFYERMKELYLPDWSTFGGRFDNGKALQIQSLQF